MNPKMNVVNVCVMTVKNDIIKVPGNPEPGTPELGEIEKERFQLFHKLTSRSGQQDRHEGLFNLPQVEGKW